ncbi:MAG: DUF305 domain-containing protein [Blastocatellia bacterium]|jgi:uncharacterized protein (DUF305 family)|nr:DUF305 domain-containing protein [Blastocatellia bacterium]
MTGFCVFNFRRSAFALLFATVFGMSSYAQSVIVQPGAPGQPTKVLPADTKPKLTALSPKDVEFMQGMIMHHAQAVEMVDLMATRTENKELRLLGARISQSQSDEINFMRRWLSLRGEKTEMDHSGHSGHMMMPGMLSKRQMNELAKAKGAEFDRLFLRGMIQHHQGALDMVDDLVNTAGSAQDAELFNFITDVDTGQRAEIKLMEQMLERIK